MEASEGNNFSNVMETTNVVVASGIRPTLQSAFITAPQQAHTGCWGALIRPFVHIISQQPTDTTQNTQQSPSLHPSIPSGKSKDGIIFDVERQSVLLLF